MGHNGLADWSALAGPSSTSSSLLERVKARDVEAWRGLVRLYGPMIYRWCRQSGLQGADAADIAQEVFRTVGAKVTEFRRQGPGAFRAWLRAITRNKIGAHLRHLHGDVQGKGGTAAQDLLQEVAAPPDSESAVQLQSEEGLLAHRALALVRSHFEDRTWQAFWLVVAEDRPPADVAAQLGMTVPAVYMAKSRVLCRLRQELDELSP